MKAVQYDRFGGPEVLRYLDLPTLGQVLANYSSRPPRSVSTSRTSVSA